MLKINNLNKILYFWFETIWNIVLFLFRKKLNFRFTYVNVHFIKSIEFRKKQKTIENIFFFFVKKKKLFFNKHNLLIFVLKIIFVLFKKYHKIKQIYLLIKYKHGIPFNWMLLIGGINIFYIFDSWVFYLYLMKFIEEND